MDYKKEFENLVLNVIQENGSDLHLGAGRVPVIRVTGELDFSCKTSGFNPRRHARIFR